MTTNDKRPIYAAIAGAVVVIVVISQLPSWFSWSQLASARSQVWLLFAVLLGASAMLMVFAAPRPKSKSGDDEQRDYRFVHYTVRLALALGIGAVMVAVLFVAVLLQVVPWWS